MLYQLSYSRIKQSDITDTTKLMKKTHPRDNKWEKIAESYRMTGMERGQV